MLRRRPIGKGWYICHTSDKKPFFVNKTLMKRQWDWPKEVPKASEDVLGLRVSQPFVCMR